MRGKGCPYKSIPSRFCPLPDSPDHSYQGQELGHEGIVVGHHLEEVVGLGADLTGNVDLHLVYVMLQPLLHQPPPALHLGGLLALHLEGVGPV